MGPEHDAGMMSTDPLEIFGYQGVRFSLEGRTQNVLVMNDAVITAEGQLNGRPVVCCASFGVQLYRWLHGSGRRRKGYARK